MNLSQCILALFLIFFGGQSLYSKSPSEQKTSTSKEKKYTTYYKALSVGLGVAFITYALYKKLWSKTFSQLTQDNAQLSNDQHIPSKIWAAIKQGQCLNKHQKKDIFISECNELKSENAKIPEHNSQETLRIATYNVHWWQDPRGRDNFSKILEVIKSTQADIIILQEASYNEATYDNLYQQLSNLGYRYGLTDFGNTMPQAPVKFGNVILSKIPLEQTHIKTFDRNFDNNELRCYINTKILLPNNETLSIYGTHLDAFDDSEQVRTKQIKELIRSIEQQEPSSNVLIAADFNAVRKKDYSPSTWKLLVEENKKRGVTTPTTALDYLEEHNFTDCFAKACVPSPRFTVWNGTTVDFLYLPQKWHLPIKGCYTYYDPASDHLPVIMDIAINT